MGSILITLEKGVIGATEKQKNTVLGLGLKYRQATHRVKDSPAIRGMIQKVKHLARIITAPPADLLASLPAEYELGALKPQDKEEKKKPSKKLEPSAQGDALKAKSSKAPKSKKSKGAKSISKGSAKAAKSPSKKVKGK